VLPEIFEAVAEEARNEQPRRAGDSRRGDNDEDGRDAALDGEDIPPPIGDSEADVHRRDQHQADGVDGRRVKPPEGEWRRGLGGAGDEPADDRRAPSEMSRLSKRSDGQDDAFGATRRTAVNVG
jgi:hypothetical protein